MKPLLPALFLGLGVSLGAVTPVAAYPVDCAIFLCLAGGWPTSAECAHARAVFIRRITPWPVEPPLQIWNCPMRAVFRDNGRPSDLVLEIAWRGVEAEAWIPEMSLPTDLILAEGRADIDLSDPAFDFVQSIHVVQIAYSQRMSERGDCKQFATIQVGIYGEQGDFQWSRGRVADVPKASALKPRSGCGTYQFRSVFVDWRDFEGTYGFEEVRY